MYRIVFLSGPSKGKRLLIREGTVVIGRDPDCHVRLPEDDEISRKHATLEQRADGTHVRDLGSMNGVVVNGTPCREALLHNNDTLEIGKTRLQFQEASMTETEEFRRTSYLQGITAVAVALVILFELSFLVGLSLWRRDVLTPPGSEPGAGVQVSATESAVLAQAEAHLRDLQQKEAEKMALLASTTKDTARVSAELQQLKADVKALQDQITEISETTAAAPTGVVEVAAAPSPAPVPAKPDVDPLLAKAEEMLQEATAELARHNLLQADGILARIQLMAPDFLPAYIERARLFERRGMLPQAGEQWSEVLNRTVGTPLYEQAAAERLRLSRTELVRKTTSGTIQERRAAAGELPRRIRITAVAQEKFRENQQFGEIRLIRVTLKPRPSERDINGNEIRVVVTFFDEDKDTGEVSLTRAVVPKDPLRVDGEWRPNDEQIVTAAYIVPKGLRDEEEQKYDERRRYLGYLVQVYYREELQDMEARPKNLLGKADEVVSPFHLSRDGGLRRRAMAARETGEPSAPADARQPATPAGTSTDR